MGKWEGSVEEGLWMGINKTGNSAPTIRDYRLSRSRCQVWVGTPFFHLLVGGIPSPQNNKAY